MKCRSVRMARQLQSGCYPSLKEVWDRRQDRISRYLDSWGREFIPGERWAAWKTCVPPKSITSAFMRFCRTMAAFPISCSPGPRTEGAPFSPPAAQRRVVVERVELTSQRSDICDIGP